MEHEPMNFEELEEEAKRGHEELKETETRRMIEMKKLIEFQQTIIDLIEQGALNKKMTLDETIDSLEEQIGKLHSAIQNREF